MKILGIVLMTCISFQALADEGGFFFEPAATYESGKVNINFPAPLSDSNETIQGLGLGLRLGAHVADIFFLALDGRYSKPTYDSSAINGSADAIHTNYGLTAGLQTPLAGLRVWGTYILDGTLDPKEIKGVDVKYSSYKGYRVGGGFYFAVLSINYEYQEAKYDKAEVETGGFTLNNVGATDKRHIVSVSFPLRF